MVGAEEAAAGTVNVRTRDNQVSDIWEGKKGRQSSIAGGASWGLCLIDLSGLCVACVWWSLGALPAQPSGCRLSHFLPPAQVHGQRSIAEVIEVLRKEKNTRSGVSAFEQAGEAAAKEAAAADGAQQ